ncbi:sugar-binding domain-containing protein [Pararcticibacter amylolyticus]|uniref:sugar-binding domain-containing protein n=1 Tax=Pararcticibacter amylolyticus TaxID=2173175 RepID=UPI001EE480CA|nr:sugar-binding domain-containing protein [Pararcticibacter amylolyticus]
MSKTFFSILVAILLSEAFEFSASGQVRHRYNFNPDWKIFRGDTEGAETPQFDDSSWKQVTLPHSWNEDEAFKVAIDQLSTGIAWYRKHFELPPGSGDGKVLLEFEGIRQAGEFYLNGKFIGRHENGAMAFGLDITDILQPGENVLAVRTDNSWDYHEKASGSRFQWNDKNFNANYGGIAKNVWLHTTGKLYQTLPLFSFLKTRGVYIYAKDFDIPKKSAVIHASSQVKNDHDYAIPVFLETEIRDMDGSIVKTFKSLPDTIHPGELKELEASASVDNLKFWSWGYGYLYDVSTRLISNSQIVDEVVTRTGFRKTAFKNGMVYLNDRVLMMKGYAQRTSNEWPAVGASVPPWLSDYSNGLMVESNANLVRWMHITPWKQDVESCDRMGLIGAMPAGDAEKDIEGPRWEQRKALMHDAIIYNRNNPGILFYECGNESISRAHMLEMKEIRDEVDPYGGRAIGSREMLDIDEAEYGGEMLYINKSAGKPLWAMEYSRDEGLRKYWDEYSPPYHKDGAGPLYKGADAQAYNRNQDSHAIEDVVRSYEFWRERPGTGERVSSGGVNIIFSDSNTHFRGAENYRRSGEVDAMRIPKDGFYAHKVMWDGWVNPDKRGIHIIGHWNYKHGVQKNVYVVAAGERVRLFVNNKPLGFGERSNGFLFTFKNVKWEQGIIRAVSFDAGNKKLAETSLSTAGISKALKLTVMQHPTGLKADGADMALIQVEVVDSIGRRCPTALDMIHFSLEGPAEWRGGIAQGPENYILSKSLPVECGVNRVLIRSLAAAGTITVSAASEGLESAKVTIRSQPVPVSKGLSVFNPAEGLPSLMKRGPAPDEPTYTDIRKSVKVVSAEAGANNDRTKASYDDNELSDWANDGNLSTAWIKYTLEKQVLVKGMSFKFNNFRSKSYPISILVDNKEVFKGLTEKSLGYFDVSWPPVKGKTVTVRLRDGALQSRASSAEVEMNGKKLDDGVTQTGIASKGTISIIEADIYSPIR